jgi:hypothetical protein
VTGSIATQLQQAASQSSGSQATYLTQLANEFQTASQTGSASSIKLGGHHGHHGHGGGGGSDAALLAALSDSSSSSSSTSSSAAASAYSNQTTGPLQSLDSIIESAMTQNGVTPAAGD